MTKEDKEFYKRWIAYTVFISMIVLPIVLGVVYSPLWFLLFIPLIGLIAALESMEDNKEQAP